MAEKTRYSDAELEEFRAIIMEKLELAQRDYELLKASLTGADGNAINDFMSPDRVVVGVMTPTIHLLRTKYWKKVPTPYPRKKPHVWPNAS